MDFENIDKRLQRKLIEITSKDPYPLQLNPKTLYRNILSSYSTTDKRIILWCFYFNQI